MNEDIISKIKNLRNLAKSSNIHEATAAALAADKLISKFRISEQELSSVEDIAVDDDVLYETARIIGWKNNLACSLSEHYGCYVYNNNGFSATGRKYSKYKIVGIKSDRQIVHYMFAWLVFEIERLNKKNKGMGHIFCNSFCRGAVDGIISQLQASKEEEKKNAVDNNQITALQKLDERAVQAENYLKSKIKIYENKTRSLNYIDGNAYDDGVRAGQNIHLGKAIAGAGVKRLGDGNN